MERLVTVVDGGRLPSALSASSMHDWLHCELKYFFAHVERWRAPASEHTALGDVVHATLDHFYVLPAPKRTRATGDRLLAATLTDAEAVERYAHLVCDDVLWTEVRNRAAASIAGIFALEDPTSVEVEQGATSRSVEASLFGAPLRGRVDRMTTGVMWTVTNFKTGKVPSARYVPGALSAVYTYAAALAASHPLRRIPDQVQLLYLLGPEQISRPVVRAHLLDHARSIGQTWSNVKTAHATGTYAGRTGPLCGWCPFASACPLRSANAPCPGSPDSHDALTTNGLSRAGQAPIVPDRDAHTDAAEAMQPMKELDQ